MDEKVIMENLYKYSIENIEIVYRELYSNPDWGKNNDKYSNAITNFYTKLDENQKHLFFTIVKQINIDTISTLFSILEGSTPSDIDTEFSLIDEEENSYEALQDYFLAVVQEKEEN